MSSSILALGRLKSIKGFSPKDWDKYAIHIIEPLLTLYPGLTGDIFDLQRSRIGEKVTLSGTSALGFDFEISTLGKSSMPISLILTGERNSIQMTFRNTFDAFKSALQEFVNSSCQRVQALTPEQMLASVFLVQSGNN